MNELSVIRQFSKQIETQFDVQKTTLYKNNQLIIGAAVDKVSIEYYQSIPQTTVFREGNSSVLVTLLRIKNEKYMIILESKNRKAFDGLETKYMIDEIKKLGKRLGEFE